MDNGQPVLSVECRERDGTIVRHVRFCPLTIEKLKYFWERLKEFDVLFNKQIRTVDDFIVQFIRGDDIENLHATGLLWEVDDVGIIYMTDIQPGYQAVGHFSFWDRRIAGREDLLREMVKMAMREFGFKRVMVKIPLYAKPALFAVERVGFVKEGRLRKAAEYKDQWWDVNVYSMIEEDFENGNV